MESKTERTYTVTLTDTEWSWVMFALAACAVYNPEGKVHIRDLFLIAQKIGCAIGVLRRDGE